MWWWKVEEGAPLDEDSSANSKKSRSKNQKKKEKKKTRNRSNSSISSESGAGKDTKGVSWGTVEEVLFSRDQGTGSVPSSGLFPLGFGDEEGRLEVAVDVHESASQVKLIERAEKLGIAVELSGGEEEYKALETRQFDYRPGKNPLFGSCSEEER